MNVAFGMSAGRPLIPKQRSSRKLRVGSIPAVARQQRLNLFDKVVGANGTLETEEGPPGLGGPPSTCSRTYFSAEPATSRATADRPVDKSYCRRANDKAASVALASQTPISPSSMPACPTLHSSCHRRRNATQWCIQYSRAFTSTDRAAHLHECSLFSP